MGLGVSESEIPSLAGFTLGAGAYSFRASLAFGRSSLLPHLRQRVARIAFRA